MGTPFGRGSKVAAWVLAVPTLVCALLAALYVYNEVWLQWSRTGGWANMWAASIHSPIFLVFIGLALLNCLLVLVVAVWWFLNIKNPQFPHKLFTAWLLVLLASAASYYPSSQQYLAVSTLVLGPRPPR
jgi:hypothetical protein